MKGEELIEVVGSSPHHPPELDIPDEINSTQDAVLDDLDISSNYAIMAQPASTVTIHRRKKRVPADAAMKVTHVYFYDGLWHNGYEQGKSGYAGAKFAAVAAFKIFRDSLPNPQRTFVKWLLPL